MAMRKKNIVYVLMVTVLCGFYQFSVAQQSFSDSERETIAGNIENLLRGFSGSLKFSIDVPESVINKFKGELPPVSDSFTQIHLDSLLMIKVDSVKSLQRESIAKNIRSNFMDSKSLLNQYVSNFAFDYSLVPDKKLAFGDFLNKYVNLYTAVDGDFNLNYKVGSANIPKLLHYMKTAKIEKFDGGSIVYIHFLMGWLQGTYDTTQRVLKNLPDGVESFSTTSRGNNVDLTAIVYFKNFDDLSSYKIVAIHDEATSQGGHTQLEEYLNGSKGVIEKLRSYGRLHLDGKKPDSAIIPFFKELFANNEKPSLECRLFFTDTLCRSIAKSPNDSMNISTNQYIEQVIENYAYVGTFMINMIENTLQLKQEKDFFVAKWPAQMEFIPRDFNDNLPNGFGDTVNTNFYFIVKYKNQGLFTKNKRVKYLSANITDISSFDKPIIISQPDKKGSLMGGISYSPMYYGLLVDKNAAFKDFGNEFSISNSIGIDFGYYWFGKEKGTFFGVSTGFFYDMMKAGMTLDSTYYSSEYANGQTPVGSENIVFAEERVWLGDFRQTLKFNTYSIPLMFNYMKELETKTLFSLGIGTVFSFVNQNSIKLKQPSGWSTHKGWYEVEFPNQTKGKYLLEDIPEYGYVSDVSVSIAEYQRNTNSMLISLAIKPSYSIPINDLIDKAYFRIGLNLQYGFNTLYDTDQKSEHIMYGAGSSYDVFSNGVKNNSFIIGLNIGLTYFNSEISRKDSFFTF